MGNRSYIFEFVYLSYTSKKLDKMVKYTHERYIRYKECLTRAMTKYYNANTKSIREYQSIYGKKVYLYKKERNIMNKILLEC